MQYVTPLMGLIGFATIVGTWMYTSRELYSFQFVLCKIATLWLSLCAGLYLTSFIVTEIMGRNTGMKNHDKNFELLANAATSAYLVLFIVELFPFFKEFLVLTLFSGYSYWVGLPIVLKIEGRMREIYWIVAFITAIVIHFLTFFLFGNILRSILL